MWREFGKQELAKFKKEYEDLIGFEEQQYVFVEMRATFNLPVEDVEKLSYEELKELSLDYFINDDGCNSANYEFEFDY